MNLIYIIISFTLCFLAFPGFNFWWLSFVALVPFFLALSNAHSVSKSLLYGILWSVGFSCGMGYWVFFTVLNHYEVPFAKSVLFFVLCLIIPLLLIYGTFAIIHRFLHNDGLFFYSLVIPSIWILVEYLKEIISFLIPWGAIGYALVPFTDFIQIADLIGVYGVMFIVIMINSLLSFFIIRLGLLKKLHIQQQRRLITVIGQEKYKIFMPIGFSILLICVPVIYGKYQLKSYDSFINHHQKLKKSIHATIVQGNYSSKERWSGMGFYQRISNYLEMTGTGKGDIKRVIVWPETTLNSPSKLNDKMFVEIMRYIGKNSLLISGGLKNDELENDVYNSAYFISGKGRLLRYDKHLLLPYSETSPFIDLLDPFYSAPSRFKEGNTPTCIKGPDDKVGVSICFEVLYSGFIHKSVKDGAEYLVNISNDSWFGDSPMPYLHLNVARLRAIENRRFLLRASNSGISAIISPTGDIIAGSGLFIRERVEGKFMKMEQLTVYTQFGNLILIAAALILFIALIQALNSNDKTKIKIL